MTSQAQTSSIHATWTWLTAQLNGRPLPSVVAIIGLGDGHLLEALDRHAPATRVLALEPDAAAAQAFASRPDYQTWRASGRLAYLIGPDYAGADEAWRVFPNTDDEPFVVVDPGLSQNPNVTRDDVGRAAQVLKRILFGVKGNREARRKFAPRYLVNSIRNIPAMLAGRDVRALSNAYPSVPAVIVGAGPSLDDAIDELRDLQDRALIIATDTALRPLLMAGISPQLVVGLDPSELNMRHFMALPECRDTWLVSEMALDRRATAVFEGRTFWFRASNHQPAPWLREQGIDVGQIDVWGSVLTGAFHVAVLAGCDPIVAVGADLAFTHDRPYARGTTYEFDWARNAACGVPVADSWKGQLAANAPIVVADVYGRDTKSTKSLVSFRDWLVAKAKQSGRRVVNVSDAGILFGDGVEQGTLRDLTWEQATIAPPAGHHRGWAATPASLTTELRAIRDRAAQDRHDTSPLREWIDFSGPGFSARALAAAIDEALTGGRRPKGSAGNVTSWTFEPNADLRSSVLRTLPEAVERYRATMYTEVPNAEPDNASESLGAAARLLDDIDEAIARDGEPVRRSDVPDWSPTSQAYAWPEPLQWAVLAFEGLVGRTPSTGAAAHEFGFVHAPVRLRDSGDAAALLPDRAEGNHAINALETQLMRRLAARRRTLAVITRGRSEAHLARFMTGSLRTQGESLGRVRRVPLLVRPRVPTDLGHPRAWAAYSSPRGAVCVIPYAAESVLIRPDGVVEPHLSWPQPIVGEMPFEDGGALAWGNGMRPWPDTTVSAPYVMYRSSRDGSVTTEELTVRPTFGVWHQQRLYWNCYPTPTEAPSGLMSWAPGQTARIHVPDVVLCGLQSSADALVMHPTTLVPQKGFMRTRLDTAWKWREGFPLEPLRLDDDGAAAGRGTAHGWTVTAYPEADVLRCESASGERLSMVCYYPWRVAWSGGTLVVTTVDREVLVFEAFVEALNDAVREGYAVAAR